MISRAAISSCEFGREGHQRFGCPVRGLLAGLHAFKDKPTNDLMRLMKGCTVAGQSFRQDPSPLPNFLPRRLSGKAGRSVDRLSDHANHPKTAAQLVGSIEERLLVFLHVAVVSHRQTLHRDE